MSRADSSPSTIAIAERPTYGADGGRRRRGRPVGEGGVRSLQRTAVEHGGDEAVALASHVVDQAHAPIHRDQLAGPGLFRQQAEVSAHPLRDDRYRRAQLAVTLAAGARQVGRHYLDRQRAVVADRGVGHGPSQFGRDQIKRHWCYHRVLRARSDVERQSDLPVGGDRQDGEQRATLRLHGRPYLVEPLQHPARDRQDRTGPGHHCRVRRLVRGRLPGRLPRVGFG